MSLPGHPGDGGAAVPDIPHDELVAGLAAGSFTLVDVLAPESYESGHIPGALSLPLADLPDRAGAVLPDRNGAIVTYCGGYT